MKFFKAFLFIAAVSLISCSKTKVPDSKVGVQRANEPMQIILFNYEFNPAELTVPLGKKVVFTNKEAAKHCLRIEALDISEDMEPEATFSHTFNKAGTFDLTSSCDPPRMKGQIIVK